MCKVHVPVSTRFTVWPIGYTYGFLIKKFVTSGNFLWFSLDIILFILNNHVQIQVYGLIKIQ